MPDLRTAIVNSRKKTALSDSGVYELLESVLHEMRTSKEAQTKFMELSAATQVALDFLEKRVNEVIAFLEQKGDAVVGESRERITQAISGIKKAYKGDKGDKGDSGKDYILTDTDRREISSQIEVPLVEKIVEKTEVVHEQPIIQKEIVQEIKEVAKYEAPERIVEKINTLPEVPDKQIDRSHIRGLDELVEEIKKSIQSVKALRLGGSGGGQGTWQYEQLSVNSGVTSFTFSRRYATVFVFFNGQGQRSGKDYTTTGNITGITLLFTPGEGELWIWGQT